MINEKKYYIYRHRRLDDFSIFYVGKGKNLNCDYKRSRTKSDKTQHWKNIVKKAGYVIEIVADNLTESDAFELEILLIKEYGRACMNEGKLVNITEGGEGTSGYKWTEEDRKKRIENSNIFRKVIDTQSLKIYDTIQEASVSLNMNYHTLSNMLLGKNSNRTTMMFLSNYTKGDKLPPARESGKTKKVINTETEEIYESVREAANSTHTSESTLGSYLRGESPNKTTMVFLEDYEKGMKLNNRREIGINRKVINTETKEIYDSIKEVAELLGMHKSTLQAQLSGRTSNKTKMVFFEDYVEGMELKFQRKESNRRKVIDTETGEIYESIKIASEVLNIKYAIFADYLYGRCKNKTTLKFLEE